MLGKITGPILAGNMWLPGWLAYWIAVRSFALLCDIHRSANSAKPSDRHRPSGPSGLAAVKLGRT